MSRAGAPESAATGGAEGRHRARRMPPPTDTRTHTDRHTDRHTDTHTHPEPRLGLPTALPQPRSPRGKTMPLTAKPRAGLGHLAHVFANTPLEWKAPGSRTPGPVTRACVLPHGLSGHVFGSDGRLASATPWVPFCAPRRQWLNEKYWDLSSHRSWCWIVLPAQWPLPLLLLLLLQEPRKQSEADADAILLGRGLGGRIGASSLFLFPSSIGYLCQSSVSYWLRKFTFFGACC